MTEVLEPEARSVSFEAGRQDWSTWPRYEAAELGFKEYWYPVTWSRKVREKKHPIRVKALEPCLKKCVGESPRS